MSFCTTLPPRQAYAHACRTFCRTFGCAMGCDWSIHNGTWLNGSVYSKNRVLCCSFLRGNKNHKVSYAAFVILLTWMCNDSLISIITGFLLNQSQVDVLKVDHDLINDILNTEKKSAKKPCHQPNNLAISNV